LLVCASPAAAETFTVNSSADPGTDGCDVTECTLREAIADAEDNANEATTVDLIEFSVTGNINLETALPEILFPVTIDGPGAGNVNVTRSPTASGPFRLLDVAPVNAGYAVTLREITLSGALATGFSGGGLSKRGPGALVLEAVVVRDNTAASGAGLHYDNGLISIRNSTFSGNHSTSEGGAIIGVAGIGAVDGDLQLVNSTIDDNSAVGFGGGIYASAAGNVQILSSTITRNEADSDNSGSGDGGGLYHNTDGQFEVANTLLAGNFLGDDDGDRHCSGNSFTSLGYNLRSENDLGCIGFGNTGDFVDGSPLIAGAPALNGGSTPNVALLPGSPAINAGNPAALGGAFPACPTTDQRGLFRGGVAGACDIGSYELNASATPPTTSGGAGTTQPPTSGTTQFNLKAAIKKCKKKFPKGPKRKKCIKRAKKRAQA
jgi:hypothetical protein